MSGQSTEWLIVAIFFACFFAFTLAEAGWLSRHGSASYGKAFAFSFATNTFSISVGFFISFVIFAVLLALAWDGTLGQASPNDARIWAAVVAAALFPMVLLLLAKRLALRLFKMSVASPWVFSGIASLVFMVLVAGVPVLFLYLR
jgi:hypothetical protein